MAHNKVWEEDQHQGGRAMGAGDMLSGLGLDEMHDVSQRTNRDGVETTHNCRHCGRQAKVITKWGELGCFYIGRKVQGCQPTHQGVIIRIKCPCGGMTPLLMNWQEIEAHVNDGARSGRLPPNMVRR